jgi:hypothetical protein
MPCILKQRTGQSPGIVSFTQNEALFGICKKSRRVRRFLTEARSEGTWLSGVHVQGDVSWMEQWPLADWHAYVMWPDPTTPFAASLPEGLLLPLNCVNFLPETTPRPRSAQLCDLVIVTRASTIKRPAETLAVLRALLDLDPAVTAAIIAPDHRALTSSKSPERQGLSPEFYDARNLFSASELPNISFIVSSVEAFGTFPLGNTLLEELIGRARFVFLYSHAEGTPRTIAEAHLLGTPCILSCNLRSGINSQLTDKNTLFVDDDPKTAAAQIHDALRDYERFTVDVEAARRAFGERAHLDQLRERLGGLVSAAGAPVEGDWYLRDLHLRLACHGQKYNSQLMDGDAGRFFRWLEAVERHDPYDEDGVLGPLFG